MGPTASGKTDLAIRLRQQLPVELISVDSALSIKKWTSEQQSQMSGNFLLLLTV